MYIPKITLVFMKLGDAALQTKANFIATSMKGNVNFPTPTPPLTDLDAAIDDYSTALLAAATRDRIKGKIKTAAKVALTSILRSLATYVNLVGNGDAAILASSGFDLSKKPAATNPLVPPRTFKATIGTNAGEAVSTCGGAGRVTMYNHQYTADPLSAASVWVNNYGKKRIFKHEGLESGKKYWFRVEVMGADGEFVYTDPVAVTIQ
jgi:hypothetical protein